MVGLSAHFEADGQIGIRAYALADGLRIVAGMDIEQAAVFGTQIMGELQHHAIAFIAKAGAVVVHADALAGQLAAALHLDVVRRQRRLEQRLDTAAHFVQKTAVQKPAPPPAAHSAGADPAGWRR